MGLDSRAVIRDELSLKLLCIATVFAAISERRVTVFAAISERRVTVLAAISFRRVTVFAAISVRIVEISVFNATPVNSVPTPLKYAAVTFPVATRPSVTFVNCITLSVTFDTFTTLSRVCPTLRSILPSDNLVPIETLPPMTNTLLPYSSTYKFEPTDKSFVGALFDTPNLGVVTISE